MATTTKRKAAARMHNPAHPGEVLREMYLDPLRISVTEAAAALEVTRKHFSEVVNGTCSVTPEMALRLADVFETDADFWLNMQMQRDLWEASQRKRRKLKSLVSPRGANRLVDLQTNT